ncbi:MAG: DUF2927 domain-containing protein [Kiloniellaceae bacterium]
MLKGKYGDQERVIVRWTRPVTIGTHDATDEDKRILHDLVREINEVLQHTSVSLEIGEFAKSDIGVIFAPHRNFSTIVDHLGFDYVEGNLGFFWVYPDDRYEIGSAAVLIAQELTGDARKYAIMQEVIQALGPTNDSPLYPDSIFYERRGVGLIKTTLAPIDRKLLRFLYTHLEPGDRLRSVRRAFEAHWNE